MTAPSDSERIRLRMQRIRNRMHSKVDELLSDAENLLDWRYYVAKFPLASVLTAAAVGYWLMPGRRITPTVQIDERSLESLAQQNAQIEAARVARSPWWRPLGMMALNYAARFALSQTLQLFSTTNPTTPARRRTAGQETFR